MIDEGYQQFYLDALAAKLENSNEIKLGDRTSVLLVKRAKNNDFLGSIVASELKNIPFTQELVAQSNDAEMAPYMRGIEANVVKINQAAGISALIVSHEKVMQNGLYFMHLSYLKLFTEPDKKKLNTVTHNYRFFDGENSFSLTFSFPLDMSEIGQPIMDKTVTELRLKK